MNIKKSVAASFVALLGRPDQPTDGVRDYITCLCKALRSQNVKVDVVEVLWAEQGWLPTLWWLFKQGRYWCDKWVIVQYTANSWSRIGVPFGLCIMLFVLHIQGLHVGVRFHDSGPQFGNSIKYHMRGVLQKIVMLLLYYLSDVSILNIPLESANWLPKNARRAVFVPVGSNIPYIETEMLKKKTTNSKPPTITVFSITGGQRQSTEVADLACALQRVLEAVPRVRLRIIGRGSLEARPVLERALHSMSIDLELYGIISAEKITHLISDADIYLFIRGGISSQRTTAIAGIACGRPIVAYAGSHTGYPLTEAGLVTVPDGDCEALAQAMIRILTDEELWEELHQRSISAYQKYFSWNCIAEQYLRCFDKTSSKRSRSLTEDSNAENKPE